MFFLGCLFEKKNEEYYLSKSKHGLSNAANHFQWNLINGLNENLQEPVKIVNALPVGTFPLQYEDLLLKDRTWSYCGAVHHEIGCINLPFIKQYQRFKRCQRLLKKTDDKEILIYSAYLPS